MQSRPSAPRWMSGTGSAVMVNVGVPPSVAVPLGLDGERGEQQVRRAGRRRKRTEQTAAVWRSPVCLVFTQRGEVHRVDQRVAVGVRVGKHDGLALG